MRDHIRIMVGMLQIARRTGSQYCLSDLESLSWRKFWGHPALGVREEGYDPSHRYQKVGRIIVYRRRNLNDGEVYGSKINRGLRVDPWGTPRVRGGGQRKIFLANKSRTKTFPDMCEGMSRQNAELQPSKIKTEPAPE